MQNIIRNVFCSAPFFVRRAFYLLFNLKRLALLTRVLGGYEKSNNNPPPPRMMTNKKEMNEA